MGSSHYSRLFKPKIFIASTTEKLDVARAVQRNLHKEFETKIWDQDALKISRYPLESLAAELEASQFGIFAATPDDFVRSRDKRYRAPRDNVVFELGMFVGRLGIRSTFVVVPSPKGDIKLPSDLDSLTVAVYDPMRKDSELVAALGPACDQIRQAIQDHDATAIWGSDRARTVGLFSEFQDQFERLIDGTKTLRVFFIHSRRWRENNNDRLHAFLRRKGSKLIAYLPNLKNELLMSSLLPHFDDGPHIPGFVSDAYRYFIGLAESFRGKVQIRAFNLYPTYSFYEFDDCIIVAMYSLSALRKDVPTIEVSKVSTLFGFFETDIKQLKDSTINLPIKTARAIAERFVPKKRTARF